MKTVLIFGGNGSIGSHIFTEFKKSDYKVFGTTTNPEKTSENILHVTTNYLEKLNSIVDIDIIIWAHGHNFNDNIDIFDKDKYDIMINGNITFILATLHYLLECKNIKHGAKMVIISSIWENYSRENKLSYSISKAALGGLVKNISFDLSKQNILINNVLPGVIDNEMSRRTLTEEQLDYIKNYMNFERLITVDDVFKTVKFLVTENTGITGQSIVVDLGFTSFRKYN